MKKILVSLGLIASLTVIISGCTTWNGISQTDKPGSYYVVTNKGAFIGTHPGALLCTSDTKTGNLACKDVNVEDKEDEDKKEENEK